jgi:hypothetical protein
MTAYKENFPENSFVRIKSCDELQKFMRPAWKYHHPVSQAQLKYADAIARVAGIAFYHGGDPLYTLDAVPGLWHEECLEVPQPKL